MHTLQLYLTNDPILLEEVKLLIKNQFGVEIYQWYKNPTGSFVNFYRMDINTDKNIWDLAFEVQSSHVGVIEVDPELTLFGQVGAYENDDDYPMPGKEKWNHELTRFPEAIEFSVEKGRLDKSQGTGIKLGQFDTGYTKHPELSNIKQYGKNFIEGDNDPTDRMIDGFLKQPSHGTRTASVIIGADTGAPMDKNNGVFPYVNFVPYRIANSVVHVINSNIDEALLAAIEDKCEVITMSMGGYPPRRSWRLAVEAAYEKGIVFCAAAGNQVRFVVYPAAYDEVIGVAAVNVNKTPWEGSSRGSGVDISAPGENVFIASSKIGDEGFVYTYGYGSGTSHATPHIAAAAALWLNHYREELESYKDEPFLRVELYRHALYLSAHVPDETWNSRKFGAGILDARKLLDITPEMAFVEYQNRNQHETMNFGIVEAEPLHSLAEKEFMYLVSNTRGIQGSEKELEIVLAKATERTVKYLENKFTFDTDAKSLVSEGTSLYKMDIDSVIRKIVAE